MTNESELTKELGELAEILEAKLPANPKSSQNEEMAKDLEQSLNNYFDSVMTAFPFQQIAEQYLKAVGE